MCPGTQPPLPPAEGLKKLFSGATMASSRGMLVTVGQVGLLLGVGFWGSAQGPQPSERSQRKAVPLPAWTSPVHPVTEVLGQSGWCPCGLPAAFPGAGGCPWALTTPATPTAVLLRPGQAAGPQHGVPVRRHLHALCCQLHRGECWRQWGFLTALGAQGPWVGPGLRGRRCWPRLGDAPLRLLGLGEPMGHLLPR